jgi:hypothetical protein
VVRDQREVIKNGAVLCRPCTSDTYFSNAKEVTWPDMNWKPEIGLKQTRKGPKMTETNCY